LGSGVAHASGSEKLQTRQRMPSAGRTNQEPKIEFGHRSSPKSLVRIGIPQTEIEFGQRE